MNRIYFVFIAMLICLTASANQLVISPKYSSTFRFAATDAWNLDLLFSGSKSVHIRLEATITSPKVGMVAKLTSADFLISPGLQSQNSFTLNTVNLTYQNQHIAAVEATTGSFPSGNYEICYHAYCVTPDCDGNGADAVYNEIASCFEIIVEPPTPILLSFPEDKSEIELRRPTFNWIPPMPISGVTGFNYLYLLVEKRKGQSCPDAIQNNRPIYKESGIAEPVKPFPAEINDLDTGKSYCWKVDGLVGNIPVAQSEVWEFKVKGPEIKKYKNTAIVIGRSLGLEYEKVCIYDTLNVVFDQSYKAVLNSNWKIEMICEECTHNTDVSGLILNKKYLGIENIRFVAADIMGLNKGKYYILKITSEKNEVFKARVLFYEK